MNDFLVLLGVFLGGATPWLEAVVVIPGGILAGGHPVPVVIAGVVGNMLTVAIAAIFGERIGQWWRRRKAAGEPEAVEEGRSKRGERVMSRYGLPALALLGPIVIGTQISAIVAVGMGSERWLTVAWITAGMTAWAIAAAITTVAGISFLGAS